MSFKGVQGTADVNDAASASTIIGPQGVGKSIRLLKGVLSVTVPAIDGGGLAHVAINGIGALIEYRMDTSSEKVFDDSDGNKQKSTSNLAVELTYTF